MFKNILNLQNHSSLIHHYFRNANRNTPGFPTNQVTMSWSTRKPGRTPSLQHAKQSLSKQTKTNQIKGNRETAAILWFWKHTWWVCQRAPCWPSHPSACLLLGTPVLILQSATGRAVWEHTADDKTSLPNGETQHQLLLPGTAGPLLPFSAALPRNALHLHLGTQTIHQQESAK